ncbi:MAG: hypothetical protein V2A72_07675, partial [Candidatus Omnitrophota bacterium]
MKTGKMKVILLAQVLCIGILTALAGLGLNPALQTSPPDSACRSDLKGMETAAQRTTDINEILDGMVTDAAYFVGDSLAIVDKKDLGGGKYAYALAINQQDKSQFPFLVIANPTAKDKEEHKDIQVAKVPGTEIEVLMVGQVDMKAALTEIAGVAVGPKAKLWGLPDGSGGIAADHIVLKIGNAYGEIGPELAEFTLQLHQAGTAEAFDVIINELNKQSIEAKSGQVLQFAINLGKVNDVSVLVVIIKVEQKLIPFVVTLGNVDALAENYREDMQKEGVNAVMLTGLLPGMEKAVSALDNEAFENFIELYGNAINFTTKEGLQRLISEGADLPLPELIGQVNRYTAPSLSYFFSQDYEVNKKHSDLMLPIHLDKLLKSENDIAALQYLQVQLKQGNLDFGNLRESVEARKPQYIKSASVAALPGITKGKPVIAVVAEFEAGFPVVLAIADYIPLLDKGELMFEGVGRETALLKQSINLIPLPNPSEKLLLLLAGNANNSSAFAHYTFLSPNRDSFEAYSAKLEKTKLPQILILVKESQLGWLDVHPGIEPMPGVGPGKNELDFLLPSENISGLSVGQFIELFYEKHDQASRMQGVIALFAYTPHPGLATDQHILDQDFNKVMKLASIDVQLNEFGYELRKLLINPIIERAYKVDGVKEIYIDELLSNFNVNSKEIDASQTIAALFSRLILTLSYEKSNTFYDGLKNIAPDIIKQKSAEDLAKAFTDFILDRLMLGMATTIDYEKALSGTLAARLVDNDAGIKNEAIEQLEKLLKSTDERVAKKIMDIATTKGLKPFAGKLGFESGLTRVFLNPGQRMEAEDEVEFLQGAMEEELIYFTSHELGVRVGHDKITELSEIFANTAYVQDISAEDISNIKRTLTQQGYTPLAEVEPADRPLDLLFPSNNLTEPMTLAKGIQSFISAIPTDKKADKEKAAKVATLIQSVDTNLSKILETTDAKATTELYNSVKNDLKDALSTIKPISVPTDKLQTKTSLEGFMQASIDLMDNAQEGVTKDANLTAAYGA